MRKSIFVVLISALVLTLGTGVAAKTQKKQRGRTATTLRPAHKTEHKSVDLGLSVQWADCNIGARSASDIGAYYAWGMLKPRSEYYDSLCTTWNRDFDYYEICGDTLYDAASVAWGKGWRMPSSDEMKALIDSCSWAWTSVNSVKGYRVTGPSGNSIFLPAAGFKIGKVTLYDGEVGYYWSAEPIGTRLAGVLTFDDKDHSWFSFQRSCGLPIRPVKVE